MDDAGKASILVPAAYRIRGAASQMERSSQMKIPSHALLVVAAMLLGNAACAEDAPQDAAAAAPQAAEKAAPPAESNPPAKPATMPKPRPGGARPKDLDLRHCLEQPTNKEIAACAGE